MSSELPFILMIGIVMIETLMLCLQVSFATSTPLRATSNLIQTTTNQDFTEYILQQFKDNVLSFVIRLPQAGIYKFQVSTLHRGPRHHNANLHRGP